MSHYTMVFDLETIPDAILGRRLLDLEESATEEEVLLALKERRLEKTGGTSDFLPHYLQRIVAISVVVSCRDWIKVWSLGNDANEKELIERFFAGIDRYRPILVSWNGCGFDLPVLHFRTLFHNVTATSYWDSGETNSEFRWNNYLNRYHTRHTDLMDVLAAYQGRAFAPLNEIALMMGFPGKMGMSGSQVLENFQQNNLQSIRDYCETDVLNTYLIYLAYQKMRGAIDESEKQFEEDRLKQFLLESGKPHLLAFLEQWKK